MLLRTPYMWQKSSLNLTFKLARNEKLQETVFCHDECALFAVELT